MSDIVKQLRHEWGAYRIANEAADEIERLREETRWQSFRIADKDCLIEKLRARNAELEAALQDVIKMIEVVCAPIATAHLRATLVKAEEK